MSALGSREKKKMERYKGKGKGKGEGERGDTTGKTHHVVDLVDAYEPSGELKHVVA